MAALHQETTNVCQRNCPTKLTTNVCQRNCPTQGDLVGTVLSAPIPARGCARLAGDKLVGVLSTMTSRSKVPLRHWPQEPAKAAQDYAIRSASKTKAAVQGADEWITQNLPPGSLEASERWLDDESSRYDVLASGEVVATAAEEAPWEAPMVTRVRRGAAMVSLHGDHTEVDLTADPEAPPGTAEHEGPTPSEDEEEIGATLAESRRVMDLADQTLAVAVDIETH
jgi:hypothetical protein